MNCHTYTLDEFSRDHLVFSTRGCIGYISVAGIKHRDKHDIQQVYIALSDRRGI